MVYVPSNPVFSFFDNNNHAATSITFIKYVVYESKNYSKDQESTQSSTTPVQEYQMGK